jgi:outer membrane protein
MKNGLLIWNAVLTLTTGYLLVTHFTAKKNSVPSTNSSLKNPAVVNSPFRIAYIEMDSIENNYQLVKDVQAEIDRKEKEYNNDLAQLDATFRKKYDGYQQQSASMSKDDIERARMDLGQLENQLKEKKLELDQNYQEFVTRRKLSLKTDIRDFLKEYNQSRNYTYIIVYEQDLYYYRDTAYNITHDVIKGLNERYRNKKG